MISNNFLQLFCVTAYFYSTFAMYSKICYVLHGQKSGIISIIILKCHVKINDKTDKSNRCIFLDYNSVIIINRPIFSSIFNHLRLKNNETSFKINLCTNTRMRNGNVSRIRYFSSIHLFDHAEFMS
jgi:hypothetical protein